MADNTEELGIRIRTDGSVEATNGVNLTGQAVENLAKKLDAAGKPLKEGDTGLKNLGNSARQTQQAFRMLPAQITDIATSLASGSPVWLVAIQQGGQIKDSFGGVGPMFREITAALGPTRLAIGGVAAVVGVALLAHQQGQREAQGYARALILSGNAAGTNAGQMADMARAVSASVGTQGKAAEALTALAATGEVARENLQGFTDLAVRMERTLDQPIEETAKRFAELGRSPLEASKKLNQGTNYLTAAVYEQIRALMARGQVEEAGAVAQKAYADAMANRTARVAQNLGTLETVALSVGRAGKWMWDQILDIGRDDTLKQKLEKARSDMARFAALPNQGGGGLLGLWEQAKYDRAVADYAAFNRSTLNEAEQAMLASGAISQAQADLRARERSVIEAGNAIALAQARAAATQREGLINRDLALGEAAAARREALVSRETATLEELRNRDSVGLADYYERRAVLDRQALQSQITVVDGQLSAERKLVASRLAVADAEIAAEQRRMPEGTAEQGQKDARLIELRARRGEIEAQQEVRLIELRTQRGALVARQSAAEVDGERASIAARAAGLTAFQDDVNQRRQAVAQFSDQMRLGNERMAVDLIANPFKRATEMAKLGIEELTRATADKVERLKSQANILDITDPQAADDTRAQIVLAEQRKADSIVLINRKLTEDLKPEWQKMLEGWQDVNLKMEETSRQFHDGWLREGEATFVRFVQTGKLNISSLKDFVLQQYAQMVWRDTFRPAFSAAGSWVASLFGFHSGGVGQSEASFTRPVMATLPRFHSGIGPDEVPAVIQRSEGVFTKGQMAAMAPVDKIAKAAGGTTITFAPVIQVDSRTDRAEVVALVDRSMRGAQAQLLEMMNRGQV